MKIELRTETLKDYLVVETVVKAAFKDLEISDQTEHLLVQRLRKSSSFIPELSIVAESEGTIIGHILLTKALIRNDQKTVESLALAPISVRPEYQKMGVGSKLILEAHKRAQSLGYTSITVVGHEDYYPRFGYEQIKTYGIQLPFSTPDENCMVVQLVPEALKGISGMFEYPKEFFQ